MLFPSVVGYSIGAVALASTATMPQEETLQQPAIAAMPTAAVVVAAPAKPAAPVSRGFVLLQARSSSGENAVQRAADGLFYVNALVNGKPVRFVVDTGASLVVLTPDDARRVGLGITADHFTSSAETANGRTKIARVRLMDVVVGSTRTTGIDAAVVDENLKVSLLGQSWMAQIESMTITGQRISFK